MPSAMACVVASVRMSIKREDSSKNPVKNFHSFFELNSYNLSSIARKYFEKDR